MIIKIKRKIFSFLFLMVLLSGVIIPSVSAIGIYYPPPGVPTPPPTPSVPSAPVIPAAPTTSPADTTSNSLPEGSTIINAITSNINANSIFGNVQTLHNDYFSVTMDKPSDSGMQFDVGGLGITSFVHDSDPSPGISKYRMETTFTILGYTDYSTSHFYKIQPTQMSYLWMKLFNTNLGIILDSDDFYLNYPDYQFSSSGSKSNGGDFDIPISVSFNLPLAGQTIGGYVIDDISTSINSLQTKAAAEIGTISATDPHFTSGAVSSAKATGFNYEQDKPSILNTLSGDAKTDLETIFETTNIGWSVEDSQDQKVTDNSHLTQGMGSNIRLATGSSNSLSGTYHCSLGAMAYHTISTIHVDFGKISVDNEGLFKSASLNYIDHRTIDRSSSVGVENHYIKQQLTCSIDIYAQTHLAAEITPQDELTVEPPAGNETIYFNNETGGSGDVDINLTNTLLQNPYFVGGVALMIVVIAVFVFVRPKFVFHVGKH